MAKHKQHYFDEDPIGESWTCSHFVLPHDIHNTMDLYVSLEYKHHKDIATSVMLLGGCKSQKLFFVLAITT
jgi:hypothetical protein